MKILLMISYLLISINVFALNIGSELKEVTIHDDNGGYVKDASAWNSSSIKDKVIVLFYVDPDEKDTNAHFNKILKEKKYDFNKFGSIAIINLAATWKPNFIIESILKSKQEEFPNTIYVKDKASVLVKEWSLKDDSSEVLLFSKDSKLLFYKSGRMSEEDIKKIINIIDNNIL